MAKKKAADLPVDVLCLCGSSASIGVSGDHCRRVHALRRTCPHLDSLSSRWLFVPRTSSQEPLLPKPRVACLNHVPIVLPQQLDDEARVHPGALAIYGTQQQPFQLFSFVAG